MSLLDKGQQPLFEKALHDKDDQVALSTAKVLGTAADERGSGLLLSVITDSKQPTELRRQAVQSLVALARGSEPGVKLVRAKHCRKS